VSAVGAERPGAEKCLYDADADGAAEQVRVDIRRAVPDGLPIPGDAGGARSGLRGARAPARTVFVAASPEFDEEA
jgi:hypothetical protein